MPKHSCRALSVLPVSGPAVLPVYGGYNAGYVAAIPEDPQGSGQPGLPSVPYMLELIRADDIEAGVKHSATIHSESTTNSH